MVAEILWAIVEGNEQCLHHFFKEVDMGMLSAPKHGGGWALIYGALQSIRGPSIWWSAGEHSAEVCKASYNGIIGDIGVCPLLPMMLHDYSGPDGCPDLDWCHRLAVPLPSRCFPKLRNRTANTR